MPELTLLLYTFTVCLSLVTIADYFEIKHSEQNVMQPSTMQEVS